MFTIQLKTRPRGARNETPPFPLGQTWYNGGVIDTSQMPATLSGSQIVGKEWVFEDINPTANPPTQRSNYYKRCIAVRNVNPLAMLPGYLYDSDVKTTLDFGAAPATAQSSAGAQRAHVDGMSFVTADPNFLGVCDEWLPVAGCPQWDICWLTIEGPTVCYTDLAASTTTNIFTLNQRVVALTAATSGATTAGRVAPQVITDSTTVQGSLNSAQVQNVVGRALSAYATSTNTGAPILIFVTDR
jgi:hypothetical protein